MIQDKELCNSKFKMIKNLIKKVINKRQKWVKRLKFDYLINTKRISIISIDF